MEVKEADRKLGTSESMVERSLVAHPMQAKTTEVSSLWVALRSFKLKIFSDESSLSNKPPSFSRAKHQDGRSSIGRGGFDDAVRYCCSLKVILSF